MESDGAGSMEADGAESVESAGADDPEKEKIDAPTRESVERYDVTVRDLFIIPAHLKNAENVTDAVKGSDGVCASESETVPEKQKKVRRVEKRNNRSINDVNNRLRRAMREYREGTLLFIFIGIGVQLKCKSTCVLVSAFGIEKDSQQSTELTPDPLLPKKHLYFVLFTFEKEEKRLSIMFLEIIIHSLYNSHNAPPWAGNNLYV